MIYNIKPVPKPRMTISDKWKKRDCVMRYIAFKDEIKLRMVELNNYDYIIFGLEMPNSWSQKKKNEMVNKPHQKRPDIDNLIKSLFDALYIEDSHIYAYQSRKYWAEKPYIYIGKEDYKKCLN